jgi:anti-sigma regulatory factor (Ser/Thr protein kinase)
MSEPADSDAFCFRLTLPAHSVSVTVCRNVLHALRERVDRDCLHRAELVISELVTNSVRHGPGPGSDVEVELMVGHDRIDGSVSDLGAAFEMPDDQPVPGQIGGFGLYIVSRVASSCEVVRTVLGNCVRFSVQPEAASTPAAESSDPGPPSAGRARRGASAERAKRGPSAVQAEH